MAVAIWEADSVLVTRQQYRQEAQRLAGCSAALVRKLIIRCTAVYRYETER
jgi:hypothetical protein